MRTLAESPLYAAADRMLRNAHGITLEDWLSKYAGVGMSSRAMAELLAVETEGVVTVSREAIRRWVAAIDHEPAA
jgi:hypothetical protein